MLSHSLRNFRRWEVFHAEQGKSNIAWSSDNNNNPRSPGRSTFADIQHGVCEMAGDFAMSLDSSQRMDLEAAVVSLVSPTRTGVADEILALLAQGVLELQQDMVLLSDDWYGKVDCLILDEMHSSWGQSTDPRAKFGVPKAITTPLECVWKRKRSMWLLDGEEIHDSAKMQEWRDVFENRKDLHENRVEGVGRFGI
jgi:hypothetical protein